MRFLHISDLHFGKTIHGVSMLENGDQPHWVNQFLELATETHPDAVLIAGDVYDRSSPSDAAAALCNRLVTGLAVDLGIEVMIIAGNHDSREKLAFAREALSRQHIHVAGRVEREISHVTLEDEYGPVTFWLLPYLFPAAVARVLGDTAIKGYEDAICKLLAEQDIDRSQRNVILAHQNVTAFGKEAERGGSESFVGTVGQVDYSVFDAFEYVALGHIHSAYPVGREEVRYPGTPLFYHFAETRQSHKGPLLISIGAKGEPVSITMQEIPPLHPMREIRGTVEELKESELASIHRGEYLRLVVTDSPLTPDICDFFRGLAESRNSVLMEQVSEYRRFSDTDDTGVSSVTPEKTVEELFADFYEARHDGESISDEDGEIVREAAEMLRDAEDAGDARSRKAATEAMADRLLDIMLRQEGDVR